MIATCSTNQCEQTPLKMPLTRDGVVTKRLSSMRRRWHSWTFWLYWTFCENISTE